MSDSGVDYKRMISERLMSVVILILYAKLVAWEDDAHNSVFKPLIRVAEVLRGLLTRLSGTC